jgi:hypothetical protein
MKKKYLVELSEQERDYLHKLISSGSAPARKEVTVVLPIGHALRAHEALSRPDALPGFLNVVHRLVKYGVFVGHAQSIRAGIFRSRIVSPSPENTAMKNCSRFRPLVVAIDSWFTVCVEVSGYGRCEPCQLRGTGRL